MLGYSVYLIIFKFNYKNIRLYKNHSAFITTGSDWTFGVSATPATAIFKI